MLLIDSTFGGFGRTRCRVDLNPDPDPRLGSRCRVDLNPDPDPRLGSR